MADSKAVERASDAPTTDACKNLQINITALAHLIELLPLGAKSGLLEPLGLLKTRVDRLQKTQKGPGLTVALQELTQELTEYTANQQKYLNQRSLIYSWASAMLVTFLEAYLEDGLSFISSKNPKLVKTLDPVTHVRVFEAQSLDELQKDLRREWANKTLKGGPEKWFSHLEKLGAGGYTADCLQHLWDTRNLIVHSQGIVSSAYLKKQGKPTLKPGERIRVNGALIEWWLGGVQDFVDPTDTFFSSYASLDPT